MAVTDAEYAMLSNAVYKDGNYISPENYGFTHIAESGKSDKGFYGEAWQRGNDVVVVFRGTDNGQNILHDLQWAVTGVKPPEFEDAKNFFLNVKKYCDDYHLSVSMTGHSLGGGAVQYVDAYLATEKGYQVPGTAFAPAGAGGLFPGVDPSSIAVTNYIRHGDMVPEKMNKQLGYQTVFLQQTTNKYEVRYDTGGIGEIVGTPDTGKDAQHSMLGYWVDTTARSIAPPSNMPSQGEIQHEIDYNFIANTHFGNDALATAIGAWQKEHPDEYKHLSTVIADASRAMPRNAEGDSIANGNLQIFYGARIAKAFQESSLPAYIDKATKHNIADSSNQVRQPLKDFPEKTVPVINTAQIMGAKTLSGADRAERVEIAAVRSTVQGLDDELSREEKAINKLLKPPPLTQSQAEEMSVGDYTKGENQALAETKKALSEEITEYNKTNRWNANMGDGLGIYKYVPRFLIKEPLMRENIEHYEKGTEKCKLWYEDLNRRANEYEIKSRQMQEKLNTPEARAFIEQTSREYLDRDRARLDRIPEMEARQAEITQLREGINRFMRDVCPASLENRHINITGDAQNPHNLLAQSDRIQAQTEPMIQQQQHMSVGIGR